MSTPRERFIATAHCAEFARMAPTVAFEAACDAALLQFQAEQPVNCQPNRPVEPLIGFDANAQMIGAQRIIQILKHIWEPVPETKPITFPKLHH